MFPTAPEFLAAANRVDFVFNVWEKEGKKLRYGNAGATDEQCVAHITVSAPAPLSWNKAGRRPPEDFRKKVIETRKGA